MHAANKVAQRHRRSWLCEGCSPAGGRSATRVCQLDAARPDAWQLLCEACDHRNCTAQLCRLKELHQQQAAGSARGPAVAPLALGKRFMLKGLPPLEQVLSDSGKRDRIGANGAVGEHVFMNTSVEPLVKLLPHSHRIAQKATAYGRIQAMWQQHKQQHKQQLQQQDATTASSKAAFATAAPAGGPINQTRGAGSEDPARPGLGPTLAAPTVGLGKAGAGAAKPSRQPSLSPGPQLTKNGKRRGRPPKELLAARAQARAQAQVIHAERYAEQQRQKSLHAQHHHMQTAGAPPPAAAVLPAHQAARYQQHPPTRQRSVNRHSPGIVTAGDGGGRADAVLEAKLDAILESLAPPEVSAGRVSAADLTALAGAEAETPLAAKSHAFDRSAGQSEPIGASNLKVVVGKVGIAKVGWNGQGERPADKVLEP